MKLAFIVPGGFAPGGRRAVIPALLAIAAELSRRHELQVFALGGPGAVTRHRLAGADVHQLGNAVGADPPRFARRARLVARLSGRLWRELGRAPRFDLVHAFWASEPGLFAAAIGLVRRTPVVLSIGGGEAIWLPEIDYGGAGSVAGRTLFRVATRQADAITVGSAFARSLLDPRTQRRAQVVPLGVDSAAFAGSAVRPPGPPWRLLHVGSINRVKDHSTLLAAFAEVVTRLGDVTLDCVGEDTLGGEIQARARALGLGDRVRFPGFVPHDELGPFYRGAHLHVISSRYESQSVVLLEAASAGLPTVGTAVGLLPTLAPAAASVVPPGQPGALAAAISSLLVDDGRRQAMGRAAQVFARAHDVTSTARAFEEIYGRVTRR